MEIRSEEQDLQSRVDAMLLGSDSDEDSDDSDKSMVGRVRCSQTGRFGVHFKFHVLLAVPYSKSLNEKWGPES